MLDTREFSKPLSLSVMILSNDHCVSETASRVFLPETLKCGFSSGCRTPQSPQCRHLERVLALSGGEIGFPDNAKFSLFFANPPGIFRSFSPWPKIGSGVGKQENSLLCTVVFVKDRTLN